MHPDVEIIIRQRKISATRSEPEAVRASRAAIEKGMSDGMKQAEREIAQAWLIRTGFLGIKTSDPERIKGGISERDLDKEHLYVRRMIRWLNACDKSAREVVIEMATDGKQLDETAINKGCSVWTISRRWRR